MTAVILYLPATTMFAAPRLALIVMTLLGGAFLLIYAGLGEAKPLAIWSWMDILGEGGTALMSALWVMLVLTSRPSGRVTSLLAGGLLAIALGAWVDSLDEFFAIPKTQLWDNWLESLLMPGGMLTLTAGLYLWRQEQFSLNDHMRKRERLFREHRAFDRITQLANADYLRRQIRLEQTRSPDQPSALILLDVDRFHQINRQYGQAEGDRVLQAISHLLLLNLRSDDLLCRYAGDRFAVLMPATSQDDASCMAQHLEHCVRMLAHHTQAHGERLWITARVACAATEQDADTLLDRLNASLELGPPNSPAMAVAV
jgi:diguanylate cyclase (GGDEF)-like protein